MKLSKLGKEIYTFFHEIPTPLTPQMLLDMNTITQHSRRINAEILHLEKLGVIRVITESNNISSYACEYELMGNYHGTV